jgi:hypothetical protein
MKQQSGYTSYPIRKKLAGDFHVVVAGKIRDSHASFHEAYQYGINHFPASEFIVQTTEELSYTQLKVFPER